MKESVFTTEIMHTLRARGYFAHKLGDAPITAAVLAVTRFTPGKPFDIVVSARGQFVAIETKQMKKFKAFSLRDMRPAQLEGLTEVVYRGGRAFVFLNVRIAADARKGVKRENRLIVFDWAWLLHRLHESSIKAAEIREWAFASKSPDRLGLRGRTVKGVFDLAAFDQALEPISLSDF